MPAWLLAATLPLLALALWALLRGWQAWARRQVVAGPPPGAGRRGHRGHLGAGTAQASVEVERREVVVGGVVVRQDLQDPDLSRHWAPLRSVELLLHLGQRVVLADVQGEAQL